MIERFGNNVLLSAYFCILRLKLSYQYIIFIEARQREHVDDNRSSEEDMYDISGEPQSILLENTLGHY